MFKVLKNEKEILETLRKNLPESSANNLVFFSSQTKSFITDPVFMSVPMEDKIVHRSYAAFETSKIFKNKIYQLDKHIDRFFNSLETLHLKNNIYSKDELRLILQKMAAIARKIEPDSDIDMRFFYSAGVGNFSIKVDNQQHTFYAIAVRVNNSVRPVDGVNETLYNVSKLRDKVATAKTTNYLLSSIITRKAQEDEGYLGIVADDEGNILEGVMSNVGFVLEGDILSVPSFEKTLPGTTVIKCMDYVEKNLIPTQIKSISRDYIKLDDVLKGRVKEAMLLGGDFVVPILKLNGFEISKIPGKVTKLCQEFMTEERLEHEARYSEKISIFEDLEEKDRKKKMGNKEEKLKGVTLSPEELENFKAKCMKKLRRAFFNC